MNVQEELKVNDRVRCKTGGPIMTVHKIESPKEITCGWFDKIDQAHEKVFARELLQKHKTPRQGMRGVV